MNINPVSFGRTVKVNAPYHVAQQAANLVNDQNVSKEEKQVQKQLKTLFFQLVYLKSIQQLIMVC